MARVCTPTANRGYGYSKALELAGENENPRGSDRHLQIELKAFDLMLQNRPTSSSSVARQLIPVDLNN
jgi:hypothetical protein